MLGAAEPLGRMVARDFASMLDRTKMSGELRLGDGALGRGRQRLVVGGPAQGCKPNNPSGGLVGGRAGGPPPPPSGNGGGVGLLGGAGKTRPGVAAVEVAGTRLR